MSGHVVRKFRKVVRREYLREARRFSYLPLSQRLRIAIQIVKGTVRHDKRKA